MVFTVKDEDEHDSGMNLVTKPVIYVDESIKDTFRDIAREINTEFSLFYKIECEHGWNFWLDPDGFFPKQRANSVHIEYDEPRPSFEYRCVIHRHPNGCHTFSSDDNNYINRNFDISLIWTEKDDFVRAQLNWLNEGDRIVFPADVQVVYDTPKRIVKLLKKIKPLTSPVTIPPVKTYKFEPAKIQGSEQKQLPQWTDAHKTIEGHDAVQLSLQEYYENQYTDTPSMEHTYSEEVAESLVVNALIEEDECIGKIITFAEQPNEFNALMDWTKNTYEKQTDYYADFENLMYGLIRASLILGIASHTIKSQVNSNQLDWQKKKYDAVLSRVIGIEKGCLASDAFTKAMEEKEAKKLKQQEGVIQ